MVVCPAGCLPSLATIPVFIGLYNSLTNVANSGRLDSQGFFWLPSLAGPTSLAARQAGQACCIVCVSVHHLTPLNARTDLAVLS